MAVQSSEDRRLLNPLNAELNPIRHLLALVGARHIVHVSRVRVNGIVPVSSAFDFYLQVLILTELLHFFSILEVTDTLFSVSEVNFSGNELKY